jgi:hypothetical protein
MKSFCTEGPIDPDANYFVPRIKLLEDGLKKVDEWRYFTLFAPRQSGKSSYFTLLCRRIQHERPEWLPIWTSFEHYHKPVLHEFLRYFQHQLLLEAGVSIKISRTALELPDFFQRLYEKLQKDIVLVIDEVEGLQSPEVLNTFLHAIRSIYHKRKRYHLRSVILVGVSNITGILQDTASPFNIADQIDIPYFTFEETQYLLEQHTQETGQCFSPEVIQGIYHNTAGQPGLANALARDLVEKRCPDAPTIGPVPFFQTLDAFMRVYVDKNISNVVNKARQYPEIMKQILFDGPVNYTTYDERLSYLRVNGVIEDGNGQCTIPVPIYQKCLYQTFKPLINGNGEIRYFRDPLISVKSYLLPDGYLDMDKVLNQYAAYVRERGNVIFSGGKAQEGIYHYNLDAYLSSFLEFLGGRVFPEVPEGGGRVDLLVLQGQKRWIIEVKRFLGPDLLERGKQQLAAYVGRSGLDVGYLVVFSDVHPESSQGRETVVGQELRWWILPVAIRVPSLG